MWLKVCPHGIAWHSLDVEYTFIEMIGSDAMHLLVAHHLSFWKYYRVSLDLRWDSSSFKILPLTSPLLCPAVDSEGPVPITPATAPLWNARGHCLSTFRPCTAEYRPKRPHLHTPIYLRHWPVPINLPHSALSLFAAQSSDSTLVEPRDLEAELVTGLEPLAPRLQLQFTRRTWMLYIWWLQEFSLRTPKEQRKRTGMCSCCHTMSASGMPCFPTAFLENSLWGRGERTLGGNESSLVCLSIPRPTFNLLSPWTSAPSG